MNASGTRSSRTTIARVGSAKGKCGMWSGTDCCPLQCVDGHWFKETLGEQFVPAMRVESELVLVGRRAASADPTSSTVVSTSRFMLPYIYGKPANTMLVLDWLRTVCKQYQHRAAPEETLLKCLHFHVKSR